MRRTEERIKGKGPRQHVAGCIGSPSSTRISLSRIQDPKESTSTIICKLFQMIVPNLSKKISFV